MIDFIQILKTVREHEDFLHHHNSASNIVHFCDWAITGISDVSHFRVQYLSRILWESIQWMVNPNIWSYFFNLGTQLIYWLIVLSVTVSIIEPHRRTLLLSIYEVSQTIDYASVESTTVNWNGIACININTVGINRTLLQNDRVKLYGWFAKQFNDRKRSIWFASIFLRVICQRNFDAQLYLSLIILTKFFWYKNELFITSFHKIINR